MSLFSQKFILSICLLMGSQLLFADSGTVVLDINAQKNMGDIYLSVSNLPSQTTGIIVSIYRSQDNFLKKADETYFFPIGTIKNNQVLLKDIAHGEFAIAVTADLNSNQLLDTKLFGIPNEPVGFANNAKSRFGPPRFKDHVVKHNHPQQKFDVSLVKI